MVEKAKTGNQTAIIQINPDSDEKYLALKNEVNLLCQSIEKMVVNSPTATVKITEDVNLGKRIGNQIEILRKSYKDPLIKYGKYIDSTFKALSDPIEGARRVAAEKIKTYNDEQREKQRRIDEENARRACEAAEMQRHIDEENARLRQEQQINTNTGEITGPDLIMPELEPEYIPPIPLIKKTSTIFGSAEEKLVLKFRLVDIKQVPADLLLLNERAVNAMLKAGVKQISGLDIWEEPEIKFRSK